MIVMAVCFSSCGKKNADEPEPAVKNPTVELLNSILGKQTQADAAAALKAKGYVEVGNLLYAPSAESKNIYTDYVEVYSQLTEEQAAKLGTLVELTVKDGKVTAVKAVRYYAKSATLIADFTEQLTAQQEACKSSYTHLYRSLQPIGDVVKSFSEGMMTVNYLLKTMDEGQIYSYHAHSTKADHWVTAKMHLKCWFTLEVGVDRAAQLFTVGKGQQVAFTRTIANVNKYAKYSLVGDLKENYDCRLLGGTEWEYLLNSRDNAADLWAYGRLDDRNGVFLFPDGFNTATNRLFRTYGPASKFDDNLIGTYLQYDALHDAGVIFLPADGTTLNGRLKNVNEYAVYWTGDVTSTEGKNESVSFASGTDAKFSHLDETNAVSVRFVVDVK